MVSNAVVSAAVGSTRNQAATASRIMLADDHPMLRLGVRRLLEGQPGFTIVGEAVDGNEAVEIAQQQQPDVLVVDLNMPAGGAPCIRRLRSACPNARVLVLSTFDDVDRAREAFKAGAHGYLTKQGGATELVNAITSVLRDEAYLDAALAPDLGPAKPDAAAERFAQLSKREQEVVSLVARGFTNKEAAEKMGISVKSVETYRSRAVTKLDLNTRSEIVGLALRLGLLSFD